MLGIIIVDHGSLREESNQAFEEIVEHFSECFPYPIVEPAHMDLAAPRIEEAFGRAVERGADHIIVHPYFLLPGRHWEEDIPALVGRAAEPFPQVTWSVTEPLGKSAKILDVIAERVESSRKEPE